MYTSAQNAVLAISIVFGVLALLSVILRFLSRRIKDAPLKTDDWLMVISLIVALANNILVAWGAGVAALGVPIPGMSTSTWIIYEKILFIQPTIMMFDLATIKISVLCFYKRIFTTPKFFLISNIMIAIVIMWGLGSFLAQVFEQWPVSDNWTPDETGGGKNFILNYADFNMAYACFDLALDVFVLSLPVFMIKHLHLTPKKKVALTGIFLLGALSVIAEAVRLWILWRVLYGPNISVILDGSLATDVIIWGTIEVCASIIAASLPMLGPLFFDQRGPESIIRSIRSILSLRSNSAGSASHSTRSKTMGSEEANREWLELEGRSRTTVSKNNLTTEQGDGIHVKKAFQATTQEEV